MFIRGVRPPAVLAGNFGGVDLSLTDVMQKRKVLRQSREQSHSPVVFRAWLALGDCSGEISPGPPSDGWPGTSPPLGS